MSRIFIEGFYWVKLSKDAPWEVARCEDAKDGIWYLTGMRAPFSASDFHKIDDNPIHDSHDSFESLAL